MLLSKSAHLTLASFHVCHSRLAYCNKQFGLFVQFILNDYKMNLQVIKYWFLASRPKTLTAAFVPVLLGMSLVNFLGFAIQLDLIVCALGSALLIQIGTNFFNDAIDFVKGTDTKERIGPTRLAQSGLIKPKVLMQAGIGSFVLAALLGVPLVVIGGWPIFWIGVLGIICGYAYTSGPFPLSYKGVGEIFVVIFFGIIAVAGIVYLHSFAWPVQAFVLGLQVGLLATVLLAINNLRDVVGDKKVNKQTFPVRFGIKSAKIEIILLLIVPFCLQFYWYLQQNYLASFLPLLVFPLVISLCNSVWQANPGSIYNKFLAKAAGVHLLFGVLLSGGLLWG